MNQKTRSKPLFINKVEDSAKKDTVISQNPTNSDYSKILKGSAFTSF